MRDISMRKRRLTVIVIIGLLTLVAFQTVSAEQNNEGNKNINSNKLKEMPNGTTRRCQLCKK